MEQKILGIDLGTNSIGLALRNVDNGGDIVNQLEYYSSIIFKSGVGNGKSGEYSYAAERTKYRSTRRLYQSRKYRIWATLRLLIAHGCCPLKDEELDQWSKYDKEKGMRRQYPIDATSFEQWVRLDFNGNGVADYSSPYQLRAELMERELDWSNQTDRYKFGRAMYHIAQRRGFKSSKGETLKDADEKDDIDNIEIGAAMKASEAKKSKGLDEYMKQNNLPTAGCAFAKLEKDGIRVRNHEEYQAVQSKLLDEVDKICRNQHIDTLDPELYHRLISTKKGEGTIFFRRPLRSQKGAIGKCTLEPTKRRCPVSHPDYEEFRAISFINNIKYRPSPNDEWQSLSDNERQQMFDTLFTRAKATFKFEDIRSWMEKAHAGIRLDYTNRTINYRDYTTVAGCPVISRLKKILGDNWKTATVQTDRERVDIKSGTVHKVSYNYEDLWHLCFSSDDFEELSEFVQERLGFDQKQASEMARMWSAMQEGYTSLSIKAIRNILPFLRKGLIYSDAVAVAKIPDIIGANRWEENEPTILAAINDLASSIAHTRLVYSIANTLISNYKSRSLDEQFAYKNTSYQLDDSDKSDIIECIKMSLGEKRWSEYKDQSSLVEEVAVLYQQFFSSSERSYYKLPKQSDSLREYLTRLFPDIPQDSWQQLYHHSQISLFPQAKPSLIDGIFVQQLGTPDIGSIKNPVALRALHVLKNTINTLLAKRMIDEDTRIVVETARDMNDANWRKAIERYQNERKKENDAIITIIREFRPNYTDVDIEKGRLLFEQNIVPQTNTSGRIKAERFALDLQKYKLWKEQHFHCLYSSPTKYINISDLFDDNKVQIEHTIPRSISFDNSLSNRTVCYTQANRAKNNRIPSELPNYNDILQRIQPWVERLDHIKAQIELWRGNTRKAPTVDRKNECLQQVHQWELERDYWQAKVNTFTVRKEDLDLGFRNSQLVDTRIITKYAFHYLKSVFAKVDVEKGSVTANFRKILGVQSVDEKKDRQKHSHHAVDAAILTMIPVAAQRDRMIELFYQLAECPESEKVNISPKLKKEIDSCRIGSINGLLDTIEHNILVNHVSKDQTLTPAKKARRVGGHKVKGQWQQGDSIRGSLHQDTFYGAIKATDDNLTMVVRKPLKSLAEKDFDTIVDPALRKNIETQVQRFMAEEGISFAKAIEKDFYMLDADGNQIKYDRNGRPLAPIRHVRCKAKAGRGLLKADTALKIKQQTYLSKQEYKNLYYVQNDDNYLCLFYEGVDKGNPRREFRLINYFDVSQLPNKDIASMLTEPEFSVFDGNKTMPLKAIIKKGTRVLLYTNHKEEVLDLDPDQLGKRLYVIYKFNIMGTPNIYLRHHLEARKESECDKSEIGTAYSTTNRLSYLSLKATNFKALIEHNDFEVDALGNIVFK